ncbi:gamma-glutamyltransferase family protein [Natronospora cellulosivora (SeqCode)]
MNFNYLHNPYSSQRMTTIAKNGMVASSQPLAAQAGLDILKKGGNAVDAAIATAACLTVVEPTSNGIGSDAFAIVWFKDKLYGLNGSGPAPKDISIASLKEKGYTEIPRFGWIPVTVPGTPGAWAELSSRFGALPLTETLKPAITYAKDGFPVSPVTAKYWKAAYKIYKKEFSSEEFKYWFETFAPDNRAPETGEVWSSKGHAETLQSIAETNGKDFYQGKIAEKITSFSNKYGGYLKAEDLAEYSPEWIEPININYRGYDVWEIPPNGQGLVALITLNILKGFQFREKDTLDTYHKQLEAIKLAFADGKKYISDKRDMNVKVEELLSESYATERKKLIKENALTPAPGTPPKGGTVYLATADQEGNMVSFIQSNYMGFGSGLVVPGTGIALQNRGNNFKLDPNHANCLKPGKRSYHTIIPGFLTKDNNPIGPFGVMGGFMQPQGHVQVIMNTIDFQLNPQAALDAPRWQWVKDKEIKVEHNFPGNIAKLLKDKGHDISISLDSGTFGRGQIIWKDSKTGVYYGGTEARTDGSIACW